MVVPFLFLGLASILGSGILWRHKRIVTLLAAAGALLEVQWLVLTLAHRLVFTHSAPQTIFMVGSILWLIWWLPWWKGWQLPYQSVGSGWRDIAILIVLIPVVGSALLIQRANGVVDANWVAHGFYNGDTTTLIALVQRSLTTNGLVRQNPFAGNGPLEYPTLVHAGLASAVTAVGVRYDWLSFLPLILLLQILITIPLFFLLRDVVKHDGYRWGWRGLLLEAVMVLYVLGLSWEAYVYPQGHFFTMALFLLCGSLLTRAWSAPLRERYLSSGTAAIVTALLILSNAVTGVAGLVMWIVFAGLLVADTTRSRTERVVFAVSIVALLAFFLKFGAGEGALQLVPHFSYTGAQSMVMLAAPFILLLAVVLQVLRHQSFIGVTTIALGLLALVVFIFSDRNIVVDNASRFFYHALLIGWPLGVDGVVRSMRVIQARLRQLEEWPLRVSGVVAGVVALGVLAIPALASVASVHDHLLYKNTHVSKLPIRLAMEWIITNTDPKAVFLATPDEPWEIPLFTGRTLLRTNYWLSPDDELRLLVVEAFAGDSSAQVEVLRHADYILLNQADWERWNLPDSTRVYNFGGVRIYAL